MKKVLNMIPKTYTETFKRAKMELPGDRTVTEIAKELGVSAKRLYIWRKQYRVQSWMSAV
jgi:transposase-like protein